MGLLAAPIVISMMFGDAGLFTTARVGSLAGRELITGELTAVRTREAAEHAGRLWLKWKIVGIAKKKTPQHNAGGHQLTLLEKVRNSVAGHNLRRGPLAWRHVANGRPG
jgi:hypothetical protein